MEIQRNLFLGGDENEIQRRICSNAQGGNN